jgi:TRAP-type C4-dicarboxylate transport system substrate-binding protein
MAYEMSEPYHIRAVWAADEIGCRSDDHYTVEVFPPSWLGKELELDA